MVANIRGYTDNYKFKLINFDTPRWHTLEYANWNMVDALFLQSSVPQSRGGWQNNTAYLEGDRTFDEETSASYRCLISHTSATTGTFADDRLLHTDYWSLQLAGVPVYRGDWVPSVAYVLGDIVCVDDYTFYLCTVAHTASVAFPADALYWQQVFDAAQVVIDAEAAKDAAYQFSLDAQSSANDAQSSEDDAQLAEDAAKGWANDARAATGGFRWAYSSSTTAADPAVGRVAFNSAIPASVTEVYLSAYSGEIGNPDVSDWVATWDDSTNVLTRGTLQLRKIGAPEQFMIFELLGNIVDNGAWLKLPVAYINHSGSVINGEALSLGFVRAGNQGPTGTGGGDMLRANNLNDVVSIPNSRTNLGLGTAQIPTFSQVLLGNDPSQAMHAATRQYVDSSPSLVVSDTAPNATTSLAGTLWWDSDLGTLFVLYDDGNSKQWVQATATPGIDTTGLVKKSGDVMSGSLEVKMVNAALAMNSTTSAGYVDLVYKRQDKDRWILRTSNETESGSNNGSNFELIGLADAGGISATPIRINRASGIVTLAGDPTVALHAATKQYVDARALDVAAYSGMQINGNMEVSQELGATQVTLVPSTWKYAVDGWSAIANGNGAAVAVQQTAIPTTVRGFKNSLHVYTPTPYNMAVGTDLIAFRHNIEGVRFQRVGWGTPQAQPITIGFWVMTSIAGTMSLAVRSKDSTRAYVVPFSNIGGGSWEYKSVTIPGCQDGVWANDNTSGCEVYFTFAAGATYKTATANTWLASNAFATTSTTNQFTVANNGALITGVTIIPGTQAPTAAQSPMIMRPYDQELMTCQRYFEWVAYNQGFYSHIANQFMSSTTQFTVTKRAIPTIGAIANDPSLSQAITNNAANYAHRATPHGCGLHLSAVTTGECYVYGMRIAMDARL
jgi:hypothetical protein